MISFGVVLALALISGTFWALRREAAARRRSEDAARSLTAVYENVTGILFEVAVEPAGTFRFESVNQAFLRATGLSKEQVIGKRVEEIIPEPSCSLVLEKYREAVSGGKTVRWEETSVYPAGTRHGEVSVTPIFAADGAAVRLIGIVHDVTARKAAETSIREQARLLDLIFQHSLDSIVLLDKDFNFLRVSRTYASACQRPMADFIGRNHFELYPSPLQGEFEEARAQKAVYSKSARPFVFPDHPEWGTTYWDLGLVPMFDAAGEIEFFLFTLKDVTGPVRDLMERKRAEGAMRELTQVAQERARQLQALAGSLVEAEQRERRRVAALLHDNVQQLIVSAAMHVRLIGESADAGEAIHERATKAGDVLRETLAATRALSYDLCPPVLAQAGLGASLQWLAGQMRTMHKLEVEVSLCPQPPPLPDSTRDFLFTAARELLFNVVKHANVARSRVSVFAEEGCLRVSVTDEGAGFDAAGMPKENDGLGLGGIRERIALFQGRLEIDSGPGKGSRISLVVPLH